MGRMTRHGAYHKLVKQGPYVSGSAHGYHIKGTKDCEKHENEEWRHVAGGKYGQGYKHCLFCSEDFPFHKEYCAWYDFFHAWDSADPMDVVYEMDKDVVPKGCRPGVHQINEA